MFEVGEQLGTIVAGLAEHPDVAKRWAEGILAFTGVMGGAWVVLGATMARSAIQMPIAMFRLETALDKLTATIATDGTIIGSSGTAAAGGLGVLASRLSGSPGRLARSASTRNRIQRLQKPHLEAAQHNASG